MTRTIWKFPFYVSDSVAIEMPRGAVILPTIAAAAMDLLIIWAEVDPEQPAETRVLHVVGTGNPTPQRRGQFVGTAIAPPAVWHVWEADPS